MTKKDEKKRKTITEQLDEIATKICDDYCKYPHMCKSEDDLFKICEECPPELF